MVPLFSTIVPVVTYRLNRKHQRTLERIFARPTSGPIKWTDIEALFRSLGAKIEERKGSRVAIIWNGEAQVYHEPHPSPETDKGAVTDLRGWLESKGVKP